MKVRVERVYNASLKIVIVVIILSIILSGADPGILVRGGVDLFFKVMGFGARLKAPTGSRGRSPRKLLNSSDFRSKI